ncbi:kinase-like domain-containing protein [Lentinula aff. detonsa]|uniref:Kinase-like domain-containing protein n=1 Tax=Lentinula aff. detonsa TaxID=2804958 RepID=A0AA38NNE1_9AGAR|nr:kinase-like domain-containing protein [Lentinula aff. detonsa]
MSLLDWVGVNDPWIGVNVDLVALQSIVCQVFRIPTSQCGPPIAIGLEHHARYARVYSFQLPLRAVVARLVSPVKPLFKTEGEVAAMNFVRSHTPLPVPTVFAYCSESSNPVGAEWLIMEYMSGVELGEAWDQLQYPQKQTLARNLTDVYDQLFRLKADGCGGIYHSTRQMDNLSAARRSPRWQPLSLKSLRLLRSHCNHSIDNGYELGPLQDVSLIDYRLVVPSPSQTMPTFTSEEYFKLVAFNSNPPTRSDFDLPTREKCVELFQSIHRLYPSSTLFGPSEPSNFYFSHGDLHGGNILIDPQSGAITGIIDWEAAGFQPLWAEVLGVEWFKEDDQRFLIGSNGPGEFKDDTAPEDIQLRAFFRHHLHRKNPDLFSCFVGGAELRAVLYAAVDDPRPLGETDIFLHKYHNLGYWKEGHRGAFPSWTWRHLDEAEMKRVAGHGDFETLWTEKWGE